MITWTPDGSSVMVSELEETSDLVRAMEAIAPIAAKHGLKIIEDGAQSIGARRKIDGVWRMPGQLGTVATLSFFPTKNLGAFGDAGAVVTADANLAQTMRMLREHGQSRKYYHDMEGYTGRLDAMASRIGNPNPSVRLENSHASHPA